MVIEFTVVVSEWICTLWVHMHLLLLCVSEWDWLSVILVVKRLDSAALPVSALLNACLLCAHLFQISNWDGASLANKDGKSSITFEVCETTTNLFLSTNRCIYCRPFSIECIKTTKLMLFQWDIFVFPPFPRQSKPGKYHKVVYKIFLFTKHNASRLFAFLTNYFFTY